MTAIHTQASNPVGGEDALALPGEWPPGYPETLLLRAAAGPLETMLPGCQQSISQQDENLGAAPRR